MMENNRDYRENEGKTTTRCECLRSSCGCPHNVGEKKKQSADQSVKGSGLPRVVSLTGTEKYALQSLLIDNPGNQSLQMLTYDMLFTTPYAKVQESEFDNLNDKVAISRTKGTSNKKTFAPKVPRRNSENHTNLWKAHELSFLRSLRKKRGLAASTESESKPSLATTKKEAKYTMPSKDPSDNGQNKEESSESLSSSSSASESDSNKTDISQCGKAIENCSLGSSSSWDDDFPNHFDSWQIMADEYAKDFGFDYKPDGDENGERKTFYILGTSSNDLKSQPHVLSPPLMESLLSFVPEQLSCENYWLKYSLVRDGASLDTLRHYCRASQYTLLAIQTTKGDVFGSFTAAPWHTGEHGYFGGGESFVWKMRHNRFDHCCSLFEQAQMESECDVYPFSGLNNCCQFCTQDFLGVGGGEIDQRLPFDQNVAAEMSKEESLGFAIALHGDLSRGTSSPSSTFCNKKLSGDEGIFEVSNLEVWTLTPCTNLEDAEKMEMRKHFLRDRTHQQSTASISSTSFGSSGPSSPMVSQREFYRRVGEDDADVYQRDQWSSTNRVAEGKSSTSMKSPSTF